MILKFYNLNLLSELQFDINKIYFHQIYL